MAESKETVKEPTPAKTPEMTTIEAIRELSAALVAQQPKNAMEMSGISKERQYELLDADHPPVKKWRIIRCKSEETGSTFDANIVESKKFPHGRITHITNYKHPAGMYKNETSGGKVPDGLQIFKGSNWMQVDEGTEVPQHALEQHYLQWRWVEYWQKDLRKYRGIEMKSHFALEEGGLKTPWQDGIPFQSTVRE